MHYQTLSYEKDEGVAFIHIGGAGAGAATIGQLADELSDVCAEITSSENTQVVILEGMGEKAFSLEEDSAVSGSGEDSGLPGPSCSIAEPVAKLELPVLAVVRGDALGQGLELALACDIRICAETSHFGFPGVKRGLIPGDGGTQRLPRVVGKAKGIEMILTGEVIDSQEALRIGLVNRVVSSGDLTTVAIKMAREMASKAPVALRYAKETVCKGMELTLEQGLYLESDLYLLLHTTKDRAEGIQAFREKRIPKFEGR